MTNVKMTIAYDGTAFQGWQEQKDGRTIEGVINQALSRMHKREIRIQGAGRTDAGVHANGQVINFFTDLVHLEPDRLCRAVGSFLPKDIRVRQAEFVEEGFHARFDARIRTYKYYVLPSELALAWAQTHCLRVVHRPRIERLNALAATLVGRHDFTTFSAPNEQVPDRVRTVYNASFAMEGPFLVFWVSAPSYLWKMVRSMVGSLLHFEQDNMSPEAFADRLAAKDRSLAGPTAPAWGLFLHKVVYKDEPLLF